jgi:ubiquinone/menaquinone biosynthesis C-methylase UbiE
MSSSFEAQSREIYEAWHRSVESASGGDETPWHRLIARHLTPGDLADARVLEIGCGRGELVQRLLDTYGRPRLVVAADFASSAVEFARRRVQQSSSRNVGWAVASMQEIPLADSTFDVVISCETVEHVADPVKALREVHRVLRPGGRLLLTTPNYLGPMGLFRGYLRMTGRRYSEGGQPICHFTSLPRTLTWLRRAGLRARCVEASGHYLPWPGRRPFEMRGLDRLRTLRWFALHSLLVAERP